MTRDRLAWATATRRNQTPLGRTDERQDEVDDSEPGEASDKHPFGGPDVGQTTTGEQCSGEDEGVSVDEGEVSLSSALNATLRCTYALTIQTSSPGTILRATEMSVRARTGR